MKKLLDKWGQRAAAYPSGSTARRVLNECISELEAETEVKPKETKPAVKPSETKGE